MGNRIKSGYNIETVDKDSELNCPICLSLIREAMGLPCGHVFCKCCLEKIKEEDLLINQLDCPYCKTKIDKNKIYPNYYINRRVLGANVYCSQKDVGCNWVGTLNSYKTHKRTCNFKRVYCPNEGCLSRIMRMQLQEHNKECIYRDVNCEHCKEVIQFYRIKIHNDSCQMIPVRCQENGCTAMVPRGELESHRADTCGFVRTDCILSHLGCDVKVLRKDSVKHITDFPSLHMYLVGRAISELQKTNKESQGLIKKMELINHQSQIKIKQLESNNQTLSKKISHLESKDENIQVQSSKIIKRSSSSLDEKASPQKKVR